MRKKFDLLTKCDIKNSIIVSDCKKKFYLLPISDKMRKKLKIKREYYRQENKKDDKVLVYGSQMLCKHIEEEHTMAELGRYVDKHVDSEIRDMKLNDVFKDKVEHLEDWTVYSCSFCADKGWVTKDKHTAGFFLFKPHLHEKEHSF